MKPALKTRLRTDFYSFVRLAFHTLTGKKLGDDRYLVFLCHEVGRFAKGETTRLLINLPPRHLKTLAASICGTAWILGNSPSAKVMVISNSEQLSKEIAHQIRKLMRSDPYKAIFDARLEKGKEAVMNFGTTAGGGVYSAPIGGALTGFGADVIIVDDLHHIDDAGNSEKMEADIEIVDTVVESRFDNPKRGGMMVIGHRIAPRDLSGCLLEQGGWHHVVLPLIAPSDCRYVTGAEPWLRRKGELLRPNAWDETKVAARQARTRLPDFETLYQQNPLHGLKPIPRDCFSAVTSQVDNKNPRVMSIDPGQAGGTDNSFSVIQVWAWDGYNHVLVAQWREQAAFPILEKACGRMISHHRPSAIVIEMTGQGPALASKIRLEPWVELFEIHPQGSKEERVNRHADLICAGGIKLGIDAEAQALYVHEFITFPNSKHTDQIDATTQYLDFMAKSPHLRLPPKQVVGVISSKTFGLLPPLPDNGPASGNSSNAQTRGLGVVKSHGRIR